MERAASPSGYFVAGGTLRPDVPSYVERPTDDELLEAALAGEYCYVLTPRQMGKSSLMVRTAQRLREYGIATAIIDLTRIGSQTSAEQGVTASTQVSESLTSIVTLVDSVTGLVGGIAVASEEQSSGIEQVNASVAQMDRVTQGNAANAEESASASEELSAQARELNVMVDTLISTVRGDQAGSTA